MEWCIRTETPLWILHDEHLFQT